MDRLVGLYTGQRGELTLGQGKICIFEITPAMHGHGDKNTS